MAVELSAGLTRWVATECRDLAETLVGGAAFVPDHKLPDQKLPDQKLPVHADAGRSLEGRSPRHRGPRPPRDPWAGHPRPTGRFDRDRVRRRAPFRRRAARGRGLGARLPGGRRPRGTRSESREKYCARHLLARIHAAMREGVRRSIEPVSPQHLMRFLLSWQHVGPGNRLLGSGGVAEVVEQLQGYEAAVDAWESAILPARVGGYHGALLDEWCGRGEVGFGRLGLRAAGARREPSPSGRGHPFARDADQPLSPRGPRLAPRRRRGPGRCPNQPKVGAALEVVDALSASRGVVRDGPVPADRAHAGRGRRSALGRDGTRAAHS